MKKFRISYDQTIVYHVVVEADNAEWAISKADLKIKEYGITAFSCIKTVPEIGDVREIDKYGKVIEEGFN